MVPRISRSRLLVPSEVCCLVNPEVLTMAHTSLGTQTIVCVQGVRSNLLACMTYDRAVSSAQGIR